MKAAQSLILALMFLVGCVSFQFSGANEPTDQTHRLTEADIDYAESDECLHEFTGDPEADLEALHAYYDARAVRIQVLKTNAWRYATALRGRVLVPQDWPERSTSRKAATLAHERVHYCERDQFRGNDFDRAYATSNNRFRFEVPAYRMSIRTRRAYGASHRALCEYIEDRLVKLRDVYWLHDLEPEQYKREARRIWELELDEPCH